MPEFHSFLRLIIIPLSIYATFCLFSHWWARGLLPPLWPLWKTDVMHTDIQAALQLACFQFFGVYVPKSRIGRLYGNSIFNFWVTVFYSNCTILHSHQQYTRVPISLHLCPHIILFFFLIIAILVDVRWYLIVFFICISLMILVTQSIFSMFIGYLNIFFGEICPFKSRYIQYIIYGGQSSLLSHSI